MKKIIFLFIVMIVISCNNKKKYKHITIIEDENINGKKEIKEVEKIEEYSNDSLASIMAYSFFCLNKKLEKDYNEKNIKKYKTTLDYKLIGEDNKYVDVNSFLTEKIKKGIEKEIFGAENIFNSTIDKESLEKTVDAQFSSYDGHHIKLQDFIKNNMNDPDSYEHISSKYIIKDDYVDVVLTFRGKNQFNATVINKVHAKCDINSGEVLDVLK